MKDILLDDDNDLLFESGDFSIGDSDNQHVYLVVKSSFGDWRESPILGANLQTFTNANFSELRLKNILKLALKADNWKLKNFAINNNEVTVTATT
jgi:hypothetical protein